MSFPNAIRQEIVQTSATVAVGPQGITFTQFAPHEVILRPDGTFYATLEQARAAGTIYAFRDPFYFRDPKTGEEYLTFTATSAIYAGPKSGAVGLARRNRGGGASWTLLPTLVAAPQVNAQLERPHFLFQEGKYYLFFTSHSFSFADDLEKGPEGLYGFVSDSASVRGHYVPLNGSGLVLGNPAAAPLQTYSYIVLPGGHVLSYINYINLGDVTLPQIGDQSRQWQREHFGGTPAPLLEIAIEGTRTRIARALTDPGR